MKFNEEKQGHGVPRGKKKFKSGDHQKLKKVIQLWTKMEGVMP